MTDRTTINIDKQTHSDASDVKEQHDDTWPEVLQFYAEYRPQVDTLEQEPMREVDTSDMEVEVSVTDIDALQERLDRIEAGVDVADLKAVTATPEDLTSLRSDVLNRLDDLETHIDGRFDEVSRR